MRHPAPAVRGHFFYTAARGLDDGDGGSVVPSHCQFLPTIVIWTRQSTWNAATTVVPLVTRELF
jgi:hypothetical protein